MPVAPIELDSVAVDLSRRFLESHAIVGSPQTNEEATVCSLTISDNYAVQKGVFLECFVALTVGTSGTAVTTKIHHTNAAGATLASTGALTATATNLIQTACQGIDAAAVLPGQIYIVTVQVTGGAAVSTVSGVSLFATVV